jgi:hypothetical protein
MRHIVTLVCLSAVPATAQTANPAGHWEGIVKMPNQDITIQVDLAKNAAGAWIGSLSVPGTTAVNVPLSEIVADADTVQFRAALEETPLFAAKFSTDANALAGDASTSKGSVPFSMTRNGDAHVTLPPPSSLLPKTLEGAWEGTIAAPSGNKRLVLNLSRDADGRAVAMLVSVDEGNQHIPVTTVTLRGDTIEMDVRGVSGTYSGTLTPSGEIAGEWTQGPAHVPLTFKHASADAK